MEFSKEDIKAIENFIIDIDILDSLECQLNKFNAFETLGIVKTEIRHSNVLAWLLNPNENHGLGDVFIKKFVQSVMTLAGDRLSNCNLNIFDISLMDYYDFIVRREWKNIDILVESEENNLVICIENKVDSKESKHQLNKYYEIINNEYKKYNKIFIFLTPEGNDASDTENWITTNYSTIMALIEKLLDLKSNNINDEVKSFINQYIEILRRYIVDNDKISEICREI
ncbi:PD-(D/E)XK nuclease family protein [Clostridium celatum]|uniref:PDDEXK-like family protein n=1 Tax=Clostridium celatum TaxID=36834 RepID=UPI0029076063|nr:PD-(D/E)XK nuclease family protein [Clostridium celatum]MDU6296185.1 PD-(D/E)XK nuclease family protein [Clostridium celatum]